MEEAAARPGRDSSGQARRGAGHRPGLCGFSGDGVSPGRPNVMIFPGAPQRYTFDVLEGRRVGLIAVGKIHDILPTALEQVYTQGIH